ncbi:hemerythrin domain-containing protein [Spirochaetota bacterium]
MSPFEIMMQEHRIIEIVLNCLSEMISDVMTQRKLKFFHAENSINFFRYYADRFHHCKEEDRLFNIVTERGIPEELEFVKDLKEEHERGRGFVKGMDKAFRDAAHGSSDMLMKFAQSGRDYIDLLRGHILKEDRVFFPMLIKSFSADDMKRLVDSFENLDIDDVDQLTGKRYPHIANELALIYNVNIDDISEEL